MRPMTAVLLASALSLLLPGGRFNAYFTPAFTDAAYQKEAAAKLEKFISGHEGGVKAKDQTKNVVAYILSR